MFEVLRKFAHRHKEARKKTLRENAKSILKRDHLMAQMQADQNKSDVGKAPTAAPVLPQLPSQVAVAAQPLQTEAAQKRSRTKKPAKRNAPTPVAATFEFMAEIDLDLKGTPAPAAPEATGLPPDFSAKLQELRSLMDF